MVPRVVDQVTERFEELVTVEVNKTVPGVWTVAVAGVMVTATAGETVAWKVWVPERLLESVTVTPKLNVPDAVGIPETVPVVRLRETPPGSCPEEIAYVKGAVPPLTTSGTL
jgi:hypothetical protein